MLYSQFFLRYGMKTSCHKDQSDINTPLGPRQDCSLGPRDQINQITSYIDASNVYGSTAEDTHQLRLMAKGTKSLFVVMVRLSQVLNMRVCHYPSE